MTAYLQVRIEAQTFALPLEPVVEIMLLPELLCIPDAPGDVLGVLAWWGQTLPVIHLAKRLGIAQPRCGSNDNLIVLRWAGCLFGVVVNQAETVFDIPDHQIDPVSLGFQPPVSLFLAGVAQVADRLIPVINPDSLVRAPEAVRELASQEMEITTTLDGDDFYRRFMPEADQKQRDKLRHRRLALGSSQGREEPQEGVAFTLVVIGQETVGIPLNQIREFITIDTPVPIPFTPEFVVGNISVRGEILTLIDIATLINAPPCSGTKKQALVVGIKDFYVGVLIEEIHDVVQIDKGKFQSPPEPKAGVIGTTFIRDKPTILLDLEPLLSYHLITPK